MSFYYGNPWLKDEWISHSEISIEESRNAANGSVSIYYRYLSNYIAGEINQKLTNEFYPFKDYKNLGSAYTWGIDLKGSIEPAKKIELIQSLSYQYGQLVDLNDPMPMIYPFSGNSTLVYFGDVQLELTLEWAASQQRIAKKTSSEDVTKAYQLIHFTLGEKWLENKLITRLRVQNLLNSFVIKHSSINNLPEIGRALMFTVSYQL